MDHKISNGLRIGAAFAFVGVALGALGAHFLKETLLANDSVATWKTAAFYHLFHSLAMIVVVRQPSCPKAVPLCFAIGIVLFSGSLYGLALTKWAVLGPITPLGGVLFLVGWAWLAIGAKAS